MPLALEEAIQTSTTLSAGELADLRAAWLRKWADRAVALQDSEAELKSSLPDHLRCILKPKRLLLWKEILEQEGYPDLGVFDELCQGTELCGEVPKSGIFEADFKPAKQAVSTLISNASSNNKSIVHRTRSSGSEDADLAVYTKTLEEVEKGWLLGPLDPSTLPQGAVISRRFGLRQPDKVRPIDDMSVSGINATVQAAERPRPHSVDVIAAITLRLMASQPGKALTGKAFDLKSAYRQLGIHPGSLRASYIAVYNPHQARPEVFQMLAVPFGATRAVYSFLRVVHALWWVGCACLKLTWSCYFDDFIVVARQGEELSVGKAVAALFTLLGWRYAEEGAKAADFADLFKALGIMVDLSRSSEGLALFRNTDKRTSELAEALREVLTAGGLTSHEANRLRGRMQFADGQLFGRSSRLCLKALSDHAIKTGTFNLSEQACRDIERFICFLTKGAPRRVSRVSGDPWIVLTDACFDETLCGIGGVLVGPEGHYRECFSAKLQPSQLKALGADSRRTVIFEAELLAVLVAMTAWAALIEACPVVFYIDNNAARDVAISGNARSPVGLKLVSGLLALEDRLSLYPWFSRVPSPSNIADAPSRLCLDPLRQLSVKEVPVASHVDAALAMCLLSG